MKVVSWTCRGINNTDTPAIPYLVWLIRKFSVNVLFLMETHLNDDHVQRLCRVLGYDYCDYVFVPPLQEDRNLLLIYRSPYINERDFNQITSLSRKWGGSVTIPGGGVFNNWLATWALIDIPFHGTPFTWCNNREGDECVYERLDRVYVTQEWLHRFPKSISVSFPISLSDHSPILFDSLPTVGRRKSPIKMESWCLGFNEVQDMIYEQWHTEINGSPMFSCTRKLKLIRFDMFKWCKSYKQCNLISWDEVHQSCAQLQLRIGQQPDHQAERILHQKVVLEAQVKLDYWKQRSKGRWLELADTNTKFF
ncbi:Nucleoporin ndc-1 [Bienertia sinuspersici]